MAGRFIAIWFRYLKTDWFSVRENVLRTHPFVLTSNERGRKIITAVNPVAEAEGILIGMNLSDARALTPTIVAKDDSPAFAEKTLHNIAIWCIRYAPEVGIHPPDSIIIDASGCAHLFGGEQSYLDMIVSRFHQLGYQVQAAIADTIGAAMAVACFTIEPRVIAPGRHLEAILPLPASALRLNSEILAKLQKLGLYHVHQFISMSRKALHRRFGDSLLLRIDQATGNEKEMLQPVVSMEPFSERLPCLEPVSTRTGIEIALQQLLETICMRLQKEQKGIRSVTFTCYRLDGKQLQVELATSRPTHNPRHLFQLFSFRLDTIQPDLGIELFTLGVGKWEELRLTQDSLWKGSNGLTGAAFSELMDRIIIKVKDARIHRYGPDEHYLPEYAYKPIALQEAIASAWDGNKCRPMQLLAIPEPIQVVSPVPDYPPMLFIRKGKRHKVIKADGPERLEQPWWMARGAHRDYYAVEDEEGRRYWVFREGYYDAAHNGQWFLHGFLA